MSKECYKVIRYITCERSNDGERLVAGCGFGQHNDVFVGIRGWDILSFPCS